ncbi:toll/interleukin-1 receptor domain-containing protein [Cryobacterium frigoriphilum]|nr:toll/interleukin-1 receptor domain-containing protein [Cryobacterium frigoriphilum]
MGSVSRNKKWSVGTESVDEIVGRIEGFLDNEIYADHQVSSKDYSLYHKDGHFFRVADLPEARRYFSGPLKSLILGYEVAPVRPAAGVTRVDFNVAAHNPKSVTLTCTLSGSNDDATHRAFERLVARVDRQLPRWLASTEPDGVEALTEERRGATGIVAYKINKDGQNFDDVDLALQTTGRRLQRVFISYSHDSEEHKRWVARLAMSLGSLGIWVIPDQYLSLGSNLPLFMNGGMINSDRVIVICTPRYVDKANQGNGGVGYESTILTAESMNDMASPRIIPVIRDQPNKPQTPIFLSGRLFIDFTDDNEYEFHVDVLARDVLGLSNRPALRGRSDSPVLTGKPESV